MRVLFLDRDGIINKDRGDYTWRVEDFTFTEHFFPFLISMRDLGFKFVVVTNQGGIDKGLYAKSDVEDLHHWMLKEFNKDGLDLLDIFYCPHHSSIQKCLCRKPGSLLFEKAIAIHGIDVANSLMLGDRERDIEAAEAAGVRGILIQSNPDWSKIEIPGLL